MKRERQRERQREREKERQGQREIARDKTLSLSLFLSYRRKNRINIKHRSISGIYGEDWRNGGTNQEQTHWGCDGQTRWRG